MELTAMRNIGPEIARKLNAIGIHSGADLHEAGSKNAFLRMKMKFPQVCLVHLYTLQGAIDDTEYNALSEDLKRDLKAFSDSLK